MSRALWIGLDRPPVAHDPGIGEQALHLGLTEASDGRPVEACESAAEVLPFAQDRQPTQSALESLEAHLLE
jgi:hypothetical protein